MYDWEIEICMWKKKTWHVLSPTTACNDRQAEDFHSQQNFTINHSFNTSCSTLTSLIFTTLIVVDVHIYFLSVSLTAEGCFDLDHLRIDYGDKFRWTFLNCLPESERKRREKVIGNDIKFMGFQCFPPMSQICTNKMEISESVNGHEGKNRRCSSGNSQHLISET